MIELRGIKMFNQRLKELLVDVYDRRMPRSHAHLKIRLAFYNLLRDELGELETARKDVKWGDIPLLTEVSSACELIERLEKDLKRVRT